MKVIRLSEKRLYEIIKESVDDELKKFELPKNWYNKKAMNQAADDMERGDKTIKDFPLYNPDGDEVGSDIKKLKRQSKPDDYKPRRTKKKGGK